MQENKLIHSIKFNEGQLTIKSIELVEIINQFREVEGRAELQHRDFMKKIRKELETLKSLGLGGEGNFSPTYYDDKQGKQRECFELTRDGMLQMLNSESALVRYKTIEYINKLEEENKELKNIHSYMIEDPIARAKAWIKEQEEKQALALENKQLVQQNNELKPKADYTDSILNNPSLITVTQIAKDYGMTAKEFNLKLNELKVQYKQSGQWFLYAEHQSFGYTHSTTYKGEDDKGRPFSKMNTKWTQKGRLFLYNLLKEHNILPLIEQ